MVFVGEGDAGIKLVVYKLMYVFLLGIGFTGMGLDLQEFTWVYRNGDKAAGVMWHCV